MNKLRSAVIPNTPTHSLWGEITDFLATNPSPQAIIAYQLPADLKARAHELLDKNGEGDLTELEHEELMDFVRMDQMMSLLKIKMKLKLKQASVEAGFVNG